MEKKDDSLPSLDALDARIRSVRRASEEETPPRASEGKSLALRSGTELMAGVGVGAFIGYQLDAWLQTRPWLTILFIFLGFAGGALNMYRAVMQRPALRDSLETLVEGSSDLPRRKDENAGE